VAVFTISLEDQVSAPAAKMVSSLGDFLKQIARSKAPIQSLGIAVRSFAAQAKSSIVEVAKNWKTLAADFAIDTSVRALKLLGNAVTFGFEKAIEVSEKRDQLRAAFDALGGGGGAGNRALAMLNKMSDTLPYTAIHMQEWARGLMAAGLAGKPLERGITAIASAEAIMGKEGEAAARQLITRFHQAGAAGLTIKMEREFVEQLTKAGVSTAALAQELGVAPKKLLTMATSADKLGAAFQSALIKSGKKPLEDMGLRWDTMVSKVRASVDELFADLGPSIKPFMREVQGLFGEFYKGGNTANSTKGLVSTVFRGLFDLARDGTRQVHLSFLELQIVFYNTVIALKPVILWIRKMYPAGLALSIVTWIVKGLAVVFAVLAIAVFIALIPLMILVFVVVAVGAAIAKLIEWISGAVSWLLKLGGAGADAGKNLSAGLAGGILAGKTGIAAAAHSAGDAAAKGLEGSLEIKSPSKRAFRIGRFVPKGAELGIDAGVRDVERAAAGVGGAAVGGIARGATSGQPGAAAAARGLVIGDVTINIHGASGDPMTLTEEAVSMLFERLALQRGLMST